MNFKKPLFWDLPKLSLKAIILLPLTIPIILRNIFLDYFHTKKTNKNIKTICIGNIYLGGTGKTPLTIKIYEILTKLKIKTATVKKFYLNQLDEQLMLKEKTSLITSKSRKDAITAGLNQSYEALIFDDGLQDREVNYDKKIVCFKLRNWIGNGQLIPSGPLREKVSSLKKYDAVFLNGDYEETKEIEEYIKSINPKIKIFKSKYVISNKNKYDLNSKYLIFSGIGNPSDFKNILLKNNFKIYEEVTFADHHNYQESDIKKILLTSSEKNLKILTTEKDFVKIPLNFKKHINYISIDLIIQNEKELTNFLIS